MSICKNCSHDDMKDAKENSQDLKSQLLEKADTQKEGEK